MSRSPGEGATSDEIRAYDVGWAATNKLIRAGRSFSGRERNCAFLNTGGGRFADISAASGLDFQDDGRGLALTDWDHDGRVDLWLMNRSGPRVRFVKNNLRTANHFVALRLEGKGGNRDAIGARVEVLPAGGAAGVRSVKSLYAGSGYLSQASKWLHFGLGGGEAEIGAVRVRWPGGGDESFAGVRPDGSYILRQGEGVAVPWQAPPVDARLFTWGEADAPVPPGGGSGSAARVILLKPAPLPANLTFTNASGNEEKLAARTAGGPLVLHLWATWCPNCRAEMVEWAASAEALAAAGLKVLSVCVDEPTGDRAADLAKAEAAAAGYGYPFEVALANLSLIENLNILQRTFIGRQSDLPLPSSLLVDAEGRVSAVYKGPVAVRQLLADREICGADEARILAGAIPYSGKWKTPPHGLLPRAFAVKLTESGLLDDARAYLQQLLPLYEGATEAGARGELAECERFLGAIAHDRREFDLAEGHYLRSLEIVPGQKQVHAELMRVYVEEGDLGRAAEQVEAILAADRNDYENLAQLGKFRAKLGRPDEAIALFRESLALHPHPETHNELADLLREQRRCAEAVEQYEAVLALRPRWPLAANNLAWIRATHPDPKLRDGSEAKRWAEVACRETGGTVPPLLGTLAAAHAEAGEFDLAVEVSERAIAAAVEFGKAELAARLGSKMELYRSGKPFRDPSLAAQPGE